MGKPHCQTDNDSVRFLPSVWRWGRTGKPHCQTDNDSVIQVMSKIGQKTFRLFLWSRTLDQRFEHKKLVPEIFQFNSDPRWDLACGRGRNFPKKLFLCFCDLGPWIRGLNTKKLVPEIFQFKSDPRWDLACGRGRNFPKKLFLCFCDLGPWIRGLNTKKLVPEIFQFKSDPRWDLACGRGRNFPKNLFLRFCDLGPRIRGLNTKNLYPKFFSSKWPSLALSHWAGSVGKGCKKMVSVSR